MNVYEEKIEKIFNECEKHIQRINSATKKMSNTMPLDADKYVNLSDDEVEHIDQFLFRFSKLQDAIGQKLFKVLLLLSEEDIDALTFIDILNKLEKIGILNANEWRELRRDRNDLAHNYDDEPEEMAYTINKLYKKKEILFKIFYSVEEYYKKMP